MIKKLNLFYEEPDADRWFKFDRYPRKLVRRIIRGKARPGGVMMVALELMKGLDILKIPYRFNDYKYAKANEKELVGVIGKPHLIFEKRLKNPIIFGAGVFSHPIECPGFFDQYPNVKKMLVPGEWMRRMCEPYYHEKVLAWPVGIDTDKWHPKIKNSDLETDFLIYNKIRWEDSLNESPPIDFIINELNNRGHTYSIIEYGKYNHNDLIKQLAAAKAAIFLCEHETQGIAYQQILATDTPILAYDTAGYWKDPSFYPNLVKYKPVSSVPYWNEDCGLKFNSIEEFPNVLDSFFDNIKTFSPRSYIIQNLTLAKCAQEYVAIYNQVNEDITNS